MWIKPWLRVSATTGYFIRMSIIGGLLALIASMLQLSAISWLWSAITIYMVMDIRHGMTLRGGLNRLFSAATGTCLGYFCAVIFVAHNWLSISLGMLTIGVIGGALSFAYPSLKLLCMNACVVLIMSKVPHIDLPIWKIAFERIANNALGIGLVFLTSAILYTNYSVNMAKAKLAEIQELNRRYLQQLLASLIDPTSLPESISTDYLKQYQRLSTGLKAMVIEMPYEQHDFSRHDFSALQHWLSLQDQIMQVLTTIAMGLTASTDNRLLECFTANFQRLLAELQQVNALGKPLLLDHPELRLKPQPLREAWLEFKQAVDEARHAHVFSHYSMEAIARFYMVYSMFETLGELSVKD